MRLGSGNQILHIIVRHPAGRDTLKHLLVIHIYIQYATADLKMWALLTDTLITACYLNLNNTLGSY